MSEILSGKELINIAKEFGTPVYVYHAEKIKEQYDKLTTAFAGQDVIFFMPAKPSLILIF